MVIKDEANFEEKQLQDNYTQDISKINEEILRLKNQIITNKKKKDTSAVQIDNLIEIHKEKVSSLDQKPWAFETTIVWTDQYDSSTERSTAREK